MKDSGKSGPVSGASAPDNRPVWVPGVGWRYPTKHNHKRRMHGHDYAAPGIYLITLVVEGRQPVFGSIVGDLHAAHGSPQYPALAPSELGRRLLTEELPQIQRHYPMVEVWRACLMPDHLHLIVCVTAPLPDGKRLGNVVGGFKSGVSRAWWRMQDGLRPTADALGTQPEEDSGARAAGGSGERAVGGREARERRSLFEEGYNDRLLSQEGQLRHWKAYLRDNPWRLLARRQHPEYMERSLCLIVAGSRYAAFGNFMLLRYPDKRQVYCHRKARYGQLTAEERQRCGLPASGLSDGYVTALAFEESDAYKAESLRLLDHAAGGGVLVTPGISRGELMIKNTCIAQHMPLIHLQKEPIGPYWKPEKSRFDACLAGRLLILAPLDQDAVLAAKAAAAGVEASAITDYARFHNLNDLAAQICAINYDDSLSVGMM